MKLRVVVGAIALFLAVGVLLGAVFLGPSFFSGASRSISAVGRSDSSVQQQTTGNAIVRENALPGTSSWVIPANREAVTQIQAYTSATYVLPGKSLSFYISTQLEGIHYWIDIYRLGWYGGFGGRLVSSLGEQVGHDQGYYDPSTHHLLDCVSCTVDKQSGLVEANWKSSYTMTVPPSWTTGVYLAKFTDANGMQSYAPFDVLNTDSTSTYVVVTPDTTYAAYNDWGGASLYESKNGLFSESDATAKGTEVSFDRPYVQEAGSSQVLIFEANAIRWMEHQGYDLSYISNVNLHNVPSQLLKHKAYISLGHDEYWTKEMRDGVDYARNQGVGLAFLGANAAYWQMRFEPDSQGVPNRRIVCYKVETSKNDLSRDPEYGVDNTRVTSQWRDPVLGRPENALIGVMYSDLTHKQQGFVWQVNTDANSPFLSDTGLENGQAYGCGLVGYEWDRVYDNGFSPKGLHVLGASDTTTDTGTSDKSNTTYYVASSGAMVFASGSIYWENALDNYRVISDKTCGSKDVAVPGIQMLMAHIMDELVTHHTVNS
ncbi:MAG: hypothetical protein NVS4B11_11420 [Ktedonobacteraceae bacterium]